MASKKRLTRKKALENRLLITFGHVFVAGLLISPILHYINQKQIIPAGISAAALILNIAWGDYNYKKITEKYNLPNNFI